METMSIDVSTMISVNGHSTSSSPVSNDRNEMIEALSKQLVYYFSPANLLKDKFLNGVMTLNSGCVPVDILAKFANIQRIVTSFHAPMMQDFSDIGHLLCEAVQSSDYSRQSLQLIVVDHNGRFVAHHGQEYVTSDGYTYFHAIGPSDKLLLEASQPSLIETIVKNVIILRDVDDQANEDDIRAVFTHPSAVIAGVQKDVEHCWFVVLGPSTTKEDIFLILSDLRTKFIQGQPVKARLKAQTAPSTYGSLNASTRSNDSSSTTQSPLPLNNDRNHVEHTTREGQTNIGKHTFSSVNKGHQQKNQQHDATTIGRRSYGPREQGSKGHKQHGRTKRTTQNSGHNTAHGKDKQEFVVSSVTSLGIQDFPSLNWNTSDHVDPKELPRNVSKAEEKALNVESENISTSMVSFVPARGYAAALLKPAPPTLPINSPKSVSSTSDLKTQKDSDGNTSSRSSGTAPTDDSSADDKSMSSKPDSDKGSSCNNSSTSHLHASSSSSTWSKTCKSFAEVLKN